MENIHLDWLREFDLSYPLEKNLVRLLQDCFHPLYPNRRFYKQLPHLRLIASDLNGQMIGQVGLDYRVMNLNQKPIYVLGIIDLCVQEQWRGQGVGRAILEEVIQVAEQRQVDFLLLFADNTNIYEQVGFQQVSNRCTWLQINEEHQTIRGIGEAVFDELMIRPVGDRIWTDGPLDLMGYLY